MGTQQNFSKWERWYLGYAGVAGFLFGVIVVGWIAESLLAGVITGVGTSAACMFGAALICLIRRYIKSSPKRNGSA
jgi:hypothetical protein